MEKIKQQLTAGVFYSSDKNELENLFLDYDKTLKEKIIAPTRAVIAPHAGYRYSGVLAYEAIKNINKDTKNFFIIAPSHTYPLTTIGISDYDGFLTPFGTIYQNLAITNDIKNKLNLNYINEAFEKEHSIEVQLPILKYLNKDNDFKIIPILTSYNSYEIINQIISEYWEDKRNSFVISSDLSHFYSDSEAEKIDEKTAQIIESNEFIKFERPRACGHEGIYALKKFSKDNDFSLIRIGLFNSSKATNDKTRVVGYGAWKLYEENKNKYIKEYFSNFILDLCKKSIEQKGKYFPKEYNCVFDELGACFVTLEINGFLRGCIGSVVAYEPLINNLVKNAYSAAYKDPRFSPLSEDEIDKIEIKVSILSHPIEIEFSNEDDLLDNITPFKDGIIIKDGIYQAVYLPSVWEQINNKKDFLNSLKMKAGLSKNHFSKTFQAFKFYSEYIKK